DQLGALFAEEVGERNQKVLDRAFLGSGNQVDRHTRSFSSSAALRGPAGLFSGGPLNRRKGGSVREWSRSSQAPTGFLRAEPEPSHRPRWSLLRGPPAQGYADGPFRRRARSSAPPGSERRDN